MTFDEIKNTGAQGPSGTGPIQRPDRAKPPEQDPAQKLPGQVSGPADSARFTPDAEEVARYQEMAELHREAYGPLDRSEKLAQVKSRIESGHYDSPEVLEKIAGGLSTAMQVGEGESNVERASRRTEQGFYDRPDVVDQTAEGMLRDLIPPTEPE